MQMLFRKYRDASLAGLRKGAPLLISCEEFVGDAVGLGVFDEGPGEGDVVLVLMCNGSIHIDRRLRLDALRDGEVVGVLPGEHVERELRVERRARLDDAQEALLPFEPRGLSTLMKTSKTSPVFAGGP